MLGFILGTACLVGVAAVARAGRWGSPWGRYPRFGLRHGCGSFRHSEEGFRSERGYREGVFEGGMLRWLFERLQTTPGQEKVFIAALAEVRAGREKIQDEARRSRREIAEVLRAPQFDQGVVRSIFARHDALIAELRNAALDALVKIDEALDERQRRQLADLIESGPGPRRPPGGGSPWQYV